MAGVAGSNIANAVAGGIQYPAGGSSSPVVPAFQPVIGESVVNDLTPGADTNYIGVNVLSAWGTNPSVGQNVLGEDVPAGWEVPVQTTVGMAQFVVAGATIAEDAGCDITAGVAATAVPGTHTCMVVGGVTSGQYFWAVEK